VRNALLAVPFLVGSWFGTGQPDAKGSMWLIHQAADGTFMVQFRDCVKGHNQDEIETGRWSLNGDAETLQIRSVNGRPASQSDTYKILSHDAKQQVYRYLGTGFVYTSKRVDEKFEMPDCETVS
jgi:hypothetical protein